MISFRAFVDEMVKIASDDSVPSIRRLPRDMELAFESIRRRAEREGKQILGHPNIAVPVKRLGELEQHGFKRTRIAVPLPGERVGTPSWRKDDLHAHRMGDRYLMHLDEIAPTKGIRDAIRHWWREGVPASRRRIRERKAPAVES